MDDSRFYKSKAVFQDIENPQKDKKEFNPFTERHVLNPTTDFDTLIYVLISGLGSGILSMPLAFKNAGLIGGIFLTCFVTFVCTHCAYVLIKCAHILYHKTQKSEMSFAEVAQTAFTTGPSWAHWFAKPSRYLIQICLFITYFGTCSVYTVLISDNFKQIYDHYMDYSVASEGVDVRIIMSLLLIPLILLSWIPNLKYLAPVTVISNIMMASGLAITAYYLVKDLGSVSAENLSYWPKDLTKLPSSFSITVFAAEAIGVIMPLENNMRTPKHFVGTCGVLNKGMSGVTLVYILLGFFGYMRFGEDTNANITLNLPSTDLLAQVVKVLIALSVYITFGLQFFVCLEILWNSIKDRFQEKPQFANYVLRTVLVTAAVLLAVAIPKIDPFLDLIGAFCFSVLGLLTPIFIETVTDWENGFGRFNWIAVKNVIIGVFSILVLIFGSHSAIVKIMAIYCTDS